MSIIDTIKELYARTTGKSTLVDPVLKRAVERKISLQSVAQKTDFIDFLTGIELNGKSYSFEGHEYLRQIAEDPSPNIAIRKAAQVGVSTLLSAKLLWLALNSYKTAYYLTTRDTVNDFVRTNVDPIINNTKSLLRSVVKAQRSVIEIDEDDGTILKRRGKGSDTVSLINFQGGGSTYFRALQKVHHAKTIALDAVFLDEVAELARQTDPDLGSDLISFVQDRLLHSKLGLVHEFSQPSIPLMDIDASFAGGDQKYYLHRCNACNAWICLEREFPRTIAVYTNQMWITFADISYSQLDDALNESAELTLFCPRCNRPLRADKKAWVAEYPSRRGVSSYSISQLYAQASLPVIADRWKKSMRRFSQSVAFTISVLGLPHAGDRQPLTESDLYNACDPERRLDWNSIGTHVAGIDCGDNYHITVGQIMGSNVQIVWIEQTDNPERIASILEHYNATFIVDAMPYKPVSKALCRKRGRMGAILYSNVQATSYAIEDEDTEPVKVVKVNRTEMIDNLVDAILGNYLSLPTATANQTRELIEHCKRLIRDRDTDGRWTYRKGVENHYGMALAMMLVGVREAIPLQLHRPPSPRNDWAAGRTLSGYNMHSQL